MDQVSQRHADRSGPRYRLDEFAFLPAEAPLDMPVQALNGSPGGRVRDRLTMPRMVVLGVTIAATAAFAYVLYQVLSVVQLTILQGIFLVLCTLCFAWITLGTTSALLGFLPSLRLGEASLSATKPRASAGRTALLFPVYQEDAARIAATVEAIAGELAARAQQVNFDIFILSDSRTPHAKTAELRAFRHLRQSLGETINIFYRARAENTGKKAGNIANWVERFGGAYETFIILDADSIMSAELVVHLRDLMACSPRTALIQTVPRLVGSISLFARLQQFAVAFYGPVVAAGFAAWHREAGNYWGHNAIIRTRAFAQSAALPSLSGRPPLGGHVQSHDFIEAAFLRRAGWEVWMRADLLGSYEGCPPTIIDVAVRDRRWAQGNLQHMRIIGAKALPWVSRFHLGMGTYAYASSALWALSLIVGVILAVQSQYTLPVYFGEHRSLFPIWPVIDPLKAFYLFLATVVVVLLPKVLGIASAFLRRDLATRTPAWFVVGALVETLFSILLAPILMLTQTQAVIEVVMGRDSGWGGQKRNASFAQLAETVRFHQWHTLVGIVLAIVCAMVSVHVVAWMGPILLGLLLSIGLSVVTSATPPCWIARTLATAEDIQVPEIVAKVARLHRQWNDLLERAGGSSMPSG